jgi:hypothetical protein
MQITRTGVVKYRLASGPVPHYKEIVKLAGPIISVLINEFGTKKVIEKFSDPLWFHCFACTVGFEWQFSGMGTVPLMALKEALEKENVGIKVIGGKGKESKAINEIPKIAEELNLQTNLLEQLKKASILTCKVDTCELQDNHSLYFHCMIIDEKGNYTTINQKMNVKLRTARRFHWISNPKQFVEEPHYSLLGEEQKIVLDLTSKESRECRKTIVDLVCDTKPEKIQKTILSLSREKGQSQLIDFIHNSSNIKIVKLPYFMKIPKRINLEALKIAHELAERDFESLLGVKGIGPSTIRGLAYISSLIYGNSASFKDPIRYTYAFGTKAKIPYPVDKVAMREAAEILKSAVENAKIGKREQLEAIKRLKDFLEI